MLEVFSVLTRGGLVLWCFSALQTTNFDPINKFINDVLIEGKGGTKDVHYVQNFAIQYKIDAATDLIFIAMFSKSVEGEAGYVGPLLDAVQKDFTARYKHQLEDGSLQAVDYTKPFETAYNLKRDEFKEEMENKSKTARIFEETTKYTRTTEGTVMTKKAIKEKIEERKGKSTEGDGDNSSGDETLAQAKSTSPTSAKKKLLSKFKTKDKTAGKKPKSKKNPTTSSSQLRNTTSTMVEGTSRKNLDRSTDKHLKDTLSAEELSRGREEIELLSKGVMDLEVEDEEDLLGQQEESQSSSSGGFFGFFQRITGTADLTEENIKPVLDQMEQHLMGKNVATDVAQKLCASVGEKLIGQKKGTLTTIKSVVKDALNSSLQQILAPRRQFNILRDAMDCKQKGTPYSIVFCGVNGVGKSTNLAKIAFWLLTQKMRVLIAAGDTFRSGAVEQLLTHCGKLRKIFNDTDDENPIVKVFDQGYGKSDAAVAQEALHLAKANGYDVVLIDTAGRMQNNEPLMRSLTQLVTLTHPNLILFVGEALVGNEAVDQLTKFNQALQNYSQETTPRTIDGILLTKFDTVDDKVGSAISMTYITGQPIVFVGTGQHYSDLRNLNAASVAKALLQPLRK
eukprot:m.124809 g.124809  ORF g.124809 m.124809 type:complete len:622 (+) comp12964_c0_seq4:76-1941(+)